MRRAFAPAALAESKRAKAYYAREANDGVAEDFVNEVGRVVDELLEAPELGARIGERLRRQPLRRFPYSVVYEVRGEVLRIIAVAHQSRRPGYWSGRR